jgi:hypothetical protein
MEEYEDINDNSAQATLLRQRHGEPGFYNH